MKIILSVDELQGNGCAVVPADCIEFGHLHGVADLREAVGRGELVEVLQGYAGATRPFAVLYPQNRHLLARVRVFVDFLTAAPAVSRSDASDR